MPSSTSNSSGHFERALPEKRLGKLFGGAVIVVLAFLVALEIHARANGIKPNRALSMAFWQNHRFRLESQPEDATVLLGASRITFGLDHDAWEKVTGARPYNLGLHGASCLPMLHDYAENTLMRGKVICAFSGGFTFANERIPFSQRISKAVNDINKNRYSFALRTQELTGKALQARFAVLNPFLYSPIEVLREHLRFETRENEVAWFHTPFAVYHTEENQDIFIDGLADPYCLKQWDIMHSTALQYMERFEPRDLESVIKQIQGDVKTIHDRGGEVVFVRFPVSRFFREWEAERFPRQEYWDQVIARTRCRGFHYLDHTLTKDLFPPDGSHLVPEDAKVFTEVLARFVLERN